MNECMYLLSGKPSGLPVFAFFRRNRPLRFALSSIVLYIFYNICYYIK